MLRSSVMVSGIAAIALTAYGCSSASTSSTPSGPTHFAYVSSFLGTGQIAIFGLPVTGGSVPTVVSPTGLKAVADMAFDASGNLWACNDVIGPALTGYTLPLSNASTPFATINIPSSKNPVALAFDKTGNLWVADAGTGKVEEFVGPFSGSITPAPTVTITSVPTPVGLAFDAAGNLYVTNATTNVIDIFNPPFTTGQSPTATPLTGAVSPGELAFDAAGDLYTESLNGDINRWNAPTAGGGPFNLRLGGTNSLITNEAALAFDSAGNLYATNIQVAQLYVFPNAAATFSGNMPVPILVNIMAFGTNGTGGVAVR